MFRIYFLLLINICVLNSSVCVNGINFEWQDSEKGTGLKIHSELSKRIHLREIQSEDESFYVSLVTSKQSIGLMESGALTVEQAKDRFCIWLNRFENGIPFSTFMVFENNEKAGFLTIAQKESGVAELAAIVSPEKRGKSVAKECFQFANTRLSYALRSIQNSELSPLTIREKFMCLGAPLHKIYATAHPENYPSWKSLLRSGLIPLQVSYYFQLFFENCTLKHMIEESIDLITNMGINDQYVYIMFNGNHFLTAKFEQRYSAIRLYFERNLPYARTNMCKL